MLMRLPDDMPTRSGVDSILTQGKSKYGWLWLMDEAGDWWGAKYQIDFIYQVRDDPPDFPTRIWSATLGGGYQPRPAWKPFSVAFGK